MQNKGFIRVVAVLLTLICLFYLSFSVVTAIYNNKAKEYAAGDEAKYKHYIDSISTEKVYWWYYTYQQCREMEIGLGLDLKGGMNVTLQISVADVLKSLSNNNPDPNFNAAIAAAQAAQAGNNDFIVSFYNEYKKIDPNVRLSAIFSTFQLKDKITPRSTNDEVISILREELNSAVDNSYNVLRTRIDRFGVVAPNIQKLEKDGLILIELPGIKEPERVRKLLQGSANLEFWETYKLEQLAPKLDAVNNAIAAANAAQEPAEEEAPVVAEATPDTAAVAADSTASSLKKKLQQEASEAETMERIRKQNPLLSLMNYTQSYGGSPVIGIVNKNDTAAVNAMLASKIARDILPSDLILRWTVKAIDEKHLVAGREEILADAHIVRALLGERIHGSNQHILHRARFLLLGEHYGQLQQIAHHDGGSDAAGFDGDNLVDTGRGETSYKLHADGFHQYWVHLVIDEIIHFQYASRIAFSVFENTVF